MIQQKQEETYFCVRYYLVDKKRDRLLIHILATLIKIYANVVVVVAAIVVIVMLSRTA
jgi:hypothetical protein